MGGFPSNVPLQVGQTPPCRRIMEEPASGMPFYTSFSTSFSDVVFDRFVQFLVLFLIPFWYRFRFVLSRFVTRQDKTRRDKTRQDKARQDKTRQDKTRQDRTRQDKTRPGERKRGRVKENERTVKKEIRNRSSFPEGDPRKPFKHFIFSSSPSH